MGKSSMNANQQPAVKPPSFETAKPLRFSTQIVPRPWLAQAPLAPAAVPGLVVQAEDSMVLEFHLPLRRPAAGASTKLWHQLVRSWCLLVFNTSLLCKRPSYGRCPWSLFIPSCRRVAKVAGKRNIRSQKQSANVSLLMKRWNCANYRVFRGLVHMVAPQGSPRPLCFRSCGF